MSKKTKDAENEHALKHLLGKECVTRISKSISHIYPAFNQKAFLSIAPKLKALELKPRVRFLRDQLHALLPRDYLKAVSILIRSAQDGQLQGFDLWPYTEFVQTYGLDHQKVSLDALKKLTVHFTSEWAVRPFIKRDSTAAFRYLETCARDRDEHVRRWASEGTRPRLPWGERLQDSIKDPSPAFKILETLKFDDSLYVRKSVSNHLNDIAKDHPDLVVKILKRWQKEAGPRHSKKVDWIIHRALRTLIKNGHPGALDLIGVSQKTEIKLLDFIVHQRQIQVGERIEFEFKIKSTSPKPQKLVLDYLVHFVKANGTTTGKVFKLKTIELAATETRTIEKSHSFKKITTRDYYPGEHAIEIQINGIAQGKKPWRLK